MIDERELLFDMLRRICVLEGNANQDKDCPQVEKELFPELFPEKNNERTVHPEEYGELTDTIAKLMYQKAEFEDRIKMLTQTVDKLANDRVELHDRVNRLYNQSLLLMDVKTLLKEIRSKCIYPDIYINKMLDRIQRVL